MHLSPPSAIRPADLGHRRKTAIFCFLMLSMFMATLDNQIVSTALPTIVGEFGAFERFGWIGSAYLLAQSAVMPVYGKLGDLFGRKYLIMTAVGLFTLGSLVCGRAWSMDSLIAARVLQGLGAGGIMVSIFAINADLFEPRERAKYQSFSSLVIMASGSLGPTLGGTMSQVFGWRSIFLLNLPVGLAALSGLWLLLPYWRPDRKPKIDYAGAVTLALAISGLVLWADSRSLFGGFTTPPALALPPLFILSLLLWLRIEKSAPEPILPLHLFRIRNFSLLLIAAPASGAVAIGLVNYHALYLQMTTGLSPAEAGLFFIAVSGGIVIGSLSAGRLISSTGRYKPWLAIGLALATLCLAGLSLLPVGAPFWAVAALLLGQGTAIGLGQQAPVIGAQEATPPRDTGAVTGAVTLSRIGAASLAMSVYGAILARHLSAASVPGVPNLSDLSPDTLHSLSPAAREAVAQVFRDAFGTLYLTASGIACAGLVAALCLTPVILGERDRRRQAATKEGLPAE